MRYPWGHFAFGSSHLAWCNVCDQSISAWYQPWGVEQLPVAQRRNVDDHLTTHGAAANTKGGQR